MTRIPEGAELIDNPVSAAPGFRLENVFVMAGIPKIMHAMLAGILPQLSGGPPIVSVSVTGNLPEGMIADKMEVLQNQNPHISIGLYPYYVAGQAGVSVVLRGTAPQELEQLATEVGAHITALGGQLVERPTRDD